MALDLNTLAVESFVIDPVAQEDDTTTTTAATPTAIRTCGPPLCIDAPFTAGGA